MNKSSTGRQSDTERYSKLRSETRGEKITNMSAAQGWWKVSTFRHADKKAFSYEVYPVAFFAQVEYETRRVWDYGSTNWNKEVVTIAHTGGHEEWDFQVMEAPRDNQMHSHVFYDPEYRTGNKLPSHVAKWVNDDIEWRKGRVQPGKCYRGDPSKRILTADEMLNERVNGQIQKGIWERMES